MPSYFSPEQRQLLLEQGERAIQIARASPRADFVHRWEWFSSTTAREVTQLVHRPDVFAAWEDPQVKAACDQVFDGIPEKERAVSFGSLGMFCFDTPFRIAARLVGAAPEDAEPSDAVKAAIERLEAEMLAPSRHGELYAPLPGVTLPDRVEVALPLGVTLRCTTLEDLNRSHAHRAIDHPIPSACLVVAVEQPRLEGPFDQSKDVAFQAQRWIERAKTAMGVFKTGRIGESFVETRCDSWSPRAGRVGSVPFGNYKLTAEEIDPLKRIAERLEQSMWPSLEFACERLVEGEQRLRERDAILDGVIGLEGLLLLGTGSREGLRYRFAMHAAALLPVEEHAARMTRFREAYDLYKVRSDLAHTGVNAKGYPIAGVRMAGGAVAQKVKDLLRSAVHEFLLRHDGEVPKNEEKQERYWREYWERRVFGVDAEPNAGTA